jgi:hypothetical protein
VKPIWTLDSPSYAPINFMPSNWEWRGRLELRHGGEIKGDLRGYHCKNYALYAPLGQADNPLVADSFMQQQKPVPGISISFIGMG